MFFSFMNYSIHYVDGIIRMEGTLLKAVMIELQLSCSISSMLTPIT